MYRSTKRRKELERKMKQEQKRKRKQNKNSIKSDEHLDQSQIKEEDL
jgi:hypothetical protein